MSPKNSDTAFLGQPKGLSTIFYTVMWERFSYYGMRAILIYYIYYAVNKGGLGMSQYNAAAIMSIYGSLVFISTLLGGWISDRIWGTYKTTFIGGILIMLGHICLSTPLGVAALYLSIAFIVLGSGFLNPSASATVGNLYDKNDQRRDAGFSLYVFGINFGAMIAPIVVPWASSGFGFHLFGNVTNFHAGFVLAAIGMLLGLIQYYFAGNKYLPAKSFKPEDPMTKQEKKQVLIKFSYGLTSLLIVLGAMAFLHALNINNIINLITIIAVVLPIIYFTIIFKSNKVSHSERRKVIAYIPLFLAAIIFWGIEESGAVVLALFAENRTVLHVGSWYFQAANFQLLNPLFIMILTPIFVALWNSWKKQPTAPTKFAVGLGFAGLSYLVMAIPGALFGTSGRVSPLWLVLSWFIVEIGEMLISPIGLSVTTQLSPKVFKTQMMSLWYLSDAVAQAINAQIIRFYTPKTEVNYFIAVGIVSIVFGILLLFGVKKISALMGDSK